MPHTRGFSLVELSIVLVILGLLTGGILAGQSLIRAAEMRSVSTDYNRYVAAVNAFRDKYFAMPGDMSSATKFWGQATSCGGAVATGTCNGNGDNRIGRNIYGGDENIRTWQQLALASLIEGSYTTTGLSLPNVSTPASKLGSAVGFDLYYADYMGYNVSPTATRLILGKLMQPDGTMAAYQNSALRVDEAWNIDKKLDDGLPDKGSVNSWTGGDAASGCAGAGAYALSNTGLNCFMVFLVQ